MYFNPSLTRVCAKTSDPAFYPLSAFLVREEDIALGAQHKSKPWLHEEFANHSKPDIAPVKNKAEIDIPGGSLNEQLWTLFSFEIWHRRYVG